MISIQDFNLRLNDPCGRLACGPGWCRTRENSLALRDLEFWLVWRGKGWMKTRDREFVLFPGFCALMRPGGIYDAGHDEVQKLGILYIHFDMLQIEAKKASRSWPEFFELEDLPYFESVSRRVVELMRGNPAAAAVLFQGMLMDLLERPEWKRPGDGGRFQQPRRREILALVSGLRSGSPEDLPTVAAMASRLHLSSEHFSRLFRQVTGQSPMDFILEVRLGQARHLLRETSLGVGEISERLGYRDVYFFSRQFKQKTGISPLAFRRHGGGLVL